MDFMGETLQFKEGLFCEADERSRHRKHENGGSKEDMQRHEDAAQVLLPSGKQEGGEAQKVLQNQTKKPYYDISRPGIQEDVCACHYEYPCKNLQV